MEMLNKVCSRCKAEKPRIEFSKLVSSSDGLQYRCRACQKEMYQAYRQKHSAELSAKARAWSIKNAEKHRASKAKYRKNNREKIIERNRQFHAIYIKEMHHGYVKNLLKRSMNIKNDDVAIPEVLVEIKRLQLLIKRSIKNENRNPTT